MYILDIVPLCAWGSKELYSPGLVSQTPPGPGTPAYKQYRGAPEWSPEATYLANDVVSNYGYDFIRVAPAAGDLNNGGMPIYNYVGRTPLRNEEGKVGVGKNTWVKTGPSFWSKAYMPNSGSYTNIEIGANLGGYQGISHTLQIPAAIEFGGPAKGCLLINGLKFMNHDKASGEQLELVVGGLSPLHYNGCTDPVRHIEGALLPYATSLSSPDQAAALADLEVPFNEKSFVYYFEDLGNAGTGALMYAIAGKDVSNIIYQNILVCHPIYIGKTEWEGHSDTMKDYGGQTTDDWGNVTSAKRKASKMPTRQIRVKAFEGYSLAATLDMIIDLLSRLQNRFVAALFDSTELNVSGKLYEVDFNDVVVGLITSCKIHSISGDNAVLELRMQAVPSGHNV